MTGVFLQVRMRSTRLPGKALMELAGIPVVVHAMRSLRRLPAAVHALVTDESSAVSLRAPAAAEGFDVFVGSERNVLERYVFAARHYGVDEVVRATGDNPLVSWELARLAVAWRRRDAADYVGLDGPPLGTGVEVCLASALERAYASSTDDYDIEHVTPYLYRHPREFVVVRRPAPGAYHLPDALVTLDTPSDYARLSAVFDALYEGSPIPVLRLISFLKHHERDAAQHVGDAAHQRAHVDTPRT